MDDIKEEKPIIPLSGDEPLQPLTEQLRMENIFGQVITSSLVPSGVPLTFIKQCVIYKVGSDIRLYFYDTVNNTWNFIPFLNTALAIPITVPNGGTGVATLADHGVLIGNDAGTVSVTGTGTTGQILTSNGASADPTFQTLGGTDADFFGNGADGDVTIGAGTTTLTTDKHYNNLTVNGTLDCGGFRIFVKGTLSGTGIISSNGTIGANGGDGSSSVAGVAGAATSARTTGTLWGGNGGVAGAAGGAGQTGGGGGAGAAGVVGNTGGNATGTVSSNGQIGKAGNSGGNSSSGGAGAGGGAGPAGTGTNVGATPNDPWTASTMTSMIADTIYQLKYKAQNGGTGGGGGGASNTAGGAANGGGGAASGSNGSDAGVSLVFAYTIDTTGGLLFQSKGGAGGNGGNGGNATGGSGNAGGGAGGTGGSGGSGGLNVIVYHLLTGSITQTITGGVAGTQGSAGTALNIASDAQNGSSGFTGNTGIAYQINI